MKIPFDIKYRPQIESGEYKVETRSGKTARVVCWDRVETQLVVLVGKDEDVLTYNSNGTTGQQMPLPSDLFIITSEPELTEFERRIKDLLAIKCEIFYNEDIGGCYDLKGLCRVILECAREQFIKDGYVIEKKAFHDTVENISDKHRAEMSVEYSIHCKVKDGTRNAIMNWDAFQKVAQKFIDIGKAEALKDLPRWREWENGACGSSDGYPIALVYGAGGIRFTSVLGITGEKYIMLDDLKKLPGFKED